MDGLSPQHPLVPGVRAEYATTGRLHEALFIIYSIINNIYYAVVTSVVDDSGPYASPVVTFRLQLVLHDTLKFLPRVQYAFSELDWNIESRNMQLELLCLCSSKSKRILVQAVMNIHLRLELPESNLVFCRLYYVLVVERKRNTLMFLLVTAIFHAR